ncbi:M-phase phosphoprotein 8 isoform X2 [Microtus oregoni]|uniref:M-phase phosphoprotein 8 isoform X2 n=1 Tax=Microtus oregoni TaxID=111838 RepID=UPI001BB15BF1|nr:M-phase phosphoprotein 8 isoform X2 [Microtus oregoni]
MAAAAGAAVEESASVAAIAMSVPNSTGGCPGAEGEGVGAAGEEKDVAPKGAEVVGDSEEDGDDVFEVEKILDMKCEGGKNLYKVRWKGYTSDDDTWEPEIHLEDCKEVLLEFKNKLAENKAKAVKKDIQRLSLSSEIFEADCDSDQQSDTKEDASPRKKKKKVKCKEEKSPDDLKKKKTKLGKLKDKFKSELENTSENLGFDVRTKKRILEVKEELKDSKKPKKDEIKETKELKKAKRAEIRDLKFKIREDVKENRKTKKERSIESTLESESPVPYESFCPADDGEDWLSANREENQKIKTVKDKTGLDTVQEGIFEKQLDGLVSTEEDDGARVRRKKKKPRKFEEQQETKKLENTNTFLERKMIPKKQRHQDKGRSNLELSKLPSSVPAQALKGSRLSGEEKGLRSPDSAEEESKKNEPKEKYQKRYDLDKEEKYRKEPKGIKYGRQQILSLGMDLQLEWMKLEDFQKHLSGEDETFTTTNTIPSNLLRDAVKNGDYIAVKVALNSNEEYNLDQEDSSGMTLLMLAAAGGQDDLLRLLITKGAKVNGRQKNGTTALIHAAEKNFLTTVAILLEAGAFVNVQQSNGETALMKACKRGNSDIVRLVIECGADCNILSKHQNSALYFAKQCNNVLVYELLKSHLETLSRVAEETIRDYFESRLALLEAVFPIACHRLCEGPDFSTDFNYKPPQNIPDGSGVLLFIFHANFLGKEVIARLCGPCSVQAVVLNDKFQLPVFLDSHFVYSFSPVAGPNKLFIRLTESPFAKVKLLIGAYRVQLH